MEAVIDAAIQTRNARPKILSAICKRIGQLWFSRSACSRLQNPCKLKKPEEYVKKIKVGEHGLIVEKGFHKGLLLPQVPVEWDWGEEEFLCQCCVKAGLPPDSWLTKGTKVYKFSAIVFEEETPKGEVKR